MVDLKGDFAVCAYVKNPSTSDLGQDRSEVIRMYQPHFNVIGVVVGCLQVAGTEIPEATCIGLRPGRHGPEGGARVSAY